VCLLIFAEVMFKNTFEHVAELGGFSVLHPLRLVEIIMIIILINNSSSSRCTFVVTNLIIIIGIITSLMTFIENLHNLGGEQLFLQLFNGLSSVTHFTLSLSVTLHLCMRYFCQINQSMNNINYSEMMMITHQTSG